MANVITRQCRDCVDGACVDVCPVDCIVAEKPDAGLGLPKQLYINPDDCICCSICEPVCPWEAIVPEEDVPASLQEDIELNATTSTQRSAFEVPGRERIEAIRRTPSSE